MQTSAGVDRPLAGIIVVDAVQGPLAPITRYLAELGAAVHRLVDDTSLPDIAGIAANAGKKLLAMPFDSTEVRALAARAHIVVAGGSPSVNLEELRRARRSLVTMTVSDFGTGNAFSSWQATDPVLHALTGVLSRSGLRDRAPLLPPGDLAYQCAASQAAFALVAALYRALRTGVGDHIDFAALEGAMQSLDPGYGISGSATMGKPAHLLSRNRPPRGFHYPILRCADGHVRICLLARRQWRGMFRWMGEPAAFASPEFDSTTFRYKSPELLPAIGAFVSGRKRADLEAEGQRYGVPISGVLTFEECIATEHMRERNAVVQHLVADGTTVTVPNGVVSVDGERMGPGAPEAETSTVWTIGNERFGRPFEGLRVLDLGVIVVGAEQSRLLADLGADVVKVESLAYPDGTRQSHLSYGLSASFAAGHRNKRSLGINLRDPKGRELFLGLAAQADVVLSNFKPGTLEALGLGYDSIAAVNPRAVVVDSSAFGSSGPSSARMGYGPLVRAATGLTTAWRYPDDPESFSDSVTIYPDHAAARIGAMAAVALLIRRLRSGRGGTASVAQSEVMLSHFAAAAARVSTGQPPGVVPDHPWGVYQAAGEDEWCVVTVRNQADWTSLCNVIGFNNGERLRSPAERLAARPEIDTALTSWLRKRDANSAMTRLQAAGVPAARMLRVAELPSFAFYQERGAFREESHPFLQETIVAERRHAPSLFDNDPPARPAPLAGEHTAEVVRDWLGLGEDEIQKLIRSGVLEPVEETVIAAARASSPSGAETTLVAP